MKRSTLAPILVVALLSPGCDGGSEPRPACVTAAGVWDVTRVSDTGTGIVCPGGSLSWTLRQTGCDVTIESQSGDSANGATGAVSGSRLYASWSSPQDCSRVTESLDVTIDGGTMTGEYFLVRAQVIYPAVCPGVGMCRASVSGVRPAP